MRMRRPWRALGMMSGTSLDGIDAALIESDGAQTVVPGRWRTEPYSADLRARLRAVLGGVGDVAAVERALTLAHAEAACRLLAEAGIGAAEVEVIGFPGHTIAHRPEDGITWQIGDGALLAEVTGIDVVCDFRRRDLAAGGQGAPLVPLYHAALAARLDQPLAVLNLGGVANLTLVDESRPRTAFDTGPGVALIDDWVRRELGLAFDRDGAVAAGGQVDEARLTALMKHPYFTRPPPKSLDRDAFAGASAGLSPSVGAATLTAFTAAAVAAAVRHLPALPRRWVVAGGGRRNATLMGALESRLAAPVVVAETIGWAGDALEAQAFAYLAIRALRGWPLSLPETTGVARPVTGGALYRAATRRLRPRS